MLFCMSFKSAIADDASSAPDTNQAIPSKPGETVIEGDRMEIYLDRSLKSIGNASIKRDEQNIYGDTIQYDVQNDELHAIGNAKVEFKDSSLWGPELRMKLGESVGEIKDASFKMRNQFANLPTTGSIRPDALNKQTFVDPNEPYAGAAQPLSTQNIEDSTTTSASLTKHSGESRGDAKAILFEGENKKHLTDARYTTCSAGNDDWYIKAKELELDDYTKTGTAKHATVEFKGVPILYSPWMDFSYLNQRKTGLLSPTWGTTSRSGFEVLTPFYWNIAPDMDATVATRYLSKRGLQYQGEFRYLDENYSGYNNLEYLEKDSITNETRYYARLKHRQSFGNGWSAGYLLEKVSDDKYFSEMSTRIITTSRVNLPQQANLDYSGEVWKFNGLVQKYQTLNGTSYPYEKLPQLTLTGNDDVGLFNANLLGQWTKFDRNPSAIKTVATASGGVLTTSVVGDRLVAYPSISLPIQKPYGYVTPKVGFHYTSYNLDRPGFTLDGVNGNYQSDTRTLPIFSLDSGLFFDRPMRVVKNQYTQTLEPRLYYVYIPYQNQSLLPVFDSADADLNLGTLFQENQFTGSDRINNANQLSLAVTTRMIDATTGEQRLAATLGQRFYFADQRVGLPGTNLRTGNTSDIVTAVTAKLLNKWNVDTAWQYDTNTSRTVKANIGTRYNPEPGKVLNMGYRYTKERLEQINVSSQWPLGIGWYGLGRWNYSLRENQPIEGLAGLEYDAGCWQARTVLQRVSTATANANYAIFFQLELGGLASIGANPMRLLQRGIPGYTASGLIPDETQQQSYE